MALTANTKNIGTKSGLTLAAMTLLLAFAIPVGAQEPAKANAMMDMKEMKVPETAQDHLAMAQHYQKIEAQTREEIEMHKKMLADFSKTVVKNPKAGENPYDKNMRLHCAKYDKAAEALAAEAAESAKFHTLRAKELGGK